MEVKREGTALERAETKIHRVVSNLSHSNLFLSGLAIHVFTGDARHDLARLDGHRLVDHALLLGGVAHLDIAGDREILPEQVAHEALGGVAAAQVPRAADNY